MCVPFTASLVLDSGSNQALSNAQYSGSLGVYGSSATSPSAGQQEPTRGRSISRGNSSSSLYERAQSAAAAAEYRSRSQSGGSSISPVASYSPPFTASLNSLGAGTAVMHNQPTEALRNRNVQTAKPSTRREALSDTSSDEEDDSSTDTEAADDEGQAASMDFSEDAQGENTTDTDSVQFARQHGQSHGHASMKQSHNATLNDDDDAEVEQVSSPEGGRSALEQPGFDSRPANAANAGREKASLPLSHAKRGKEANAALPSSGNNEVYRTSEAKTTKREDGLNKSVSPNENGRREPGNTGDLEDRDLDRQSDVEDHLFDSPYMPSSPRITSSSNLTDFRLRNDAVATESSDPYSLSWADKEDARPVSQEQGSLMQSLVLSARHRPSWLARRQNSKSRFDSHHSLHSEDELSDPANNGYSDGYGFDDDEDQKGYLGRATELVGALWNVGTGLVWGRPEEAADTESPHADKSSSRPPPRGKR